MYLIFKGEVVDKVWQRFQIISNDYHWEINRGRDSTIVNIFNQNELLRKTYIYSFDTVGNSIAEKKIISYMGDSTIIYENDPKQRYVYLASKKVIRK